MPVTNDIQQQTDVEQAKARLQEVAETKEGRKDPRSAQQTLVVRQRSDTDEVEREFHPIQSKPKKKRFGQKLKEAMFSEDIGNGSVTEYVFFKIMIPSIKRVLSDMANTAINMALGLDPKTRTVGNTHTANASLYRDRNYSRTESANYSIRRDAVSEYEWSEADARDIMNQILDAIDRYEECTLANVYTIMGMSDKIRMADRNWGWTSPKDIDVVAVDRLSDRWIVDLPPARPLR